MKNDTVPTLSTATPRKKLPYVPARSSWMEPFEFVGDRLVDRCTDESLGDLICLTERKKHQICYCTIVCDNSKEYFLVFWIFRTKNNFFLFSRALLVGPFPFRRHQVHFFLGACGSCETMYVSGLRLLLAISYPP